MRMHHLDRLTAADLLRTIALELRDSAGRIPDYADTLPAERESADLDREAYEDAATRIEALLRGAAWRWLVSIAYGAMLLASGFLLGWLVWAAK